MQERDYGFKSADYLNVFLESDRSGRMPDFVIYPENWMQPGICSLENHSIAKFAEIAKKYVMQLIIVND